MPDLPASLAHHLRSYVARRRTVQLLRRVGLALAFALVALIATGLLDRAVPLHWAARLFVLMAIALAVPLLVWRPLRQILRRRVDWLTASRQIEQRDPALGERLITVVSQAAMTAAQRSSPDLLDSLQRQVSDHFQRHPPLARVSLRPAALPWLVAALAAVLAWTLCAVPALDMPTLILRAVAPLADVPPVTATRLAVSPGNATLEAGQVVTIRALVQPLAQEPPSLRTSPDGRNWAHSLMLPAADGAYVCSLPPAEHDLWYRVSAGDASTPVYRLRTLRRPAVAHLRVGLQDPHHASLPPRPASEHRQGPIEGPEGTLVHLEIIATEPLASATVILGKRQVPTEPTSQANVRRASFTIADNQPLIVEMLSTDNVSGRGPAGLSVRVLPDAPPSVRLSWPVGSLLVLPSSLAAMQYTARYDFGLASLSLAVQVNTRPPVDIALPLEPGSTSATGRHELLSHIEPPAPGDLIHLELVAADTRGQAARSNRLTLLVAPSAPTVQTRQAVAARARAASHAAALLDKPARSADGNEQVGNEDSTDAQRLAGLLALARNVAATNDCLRATRVALLDAWAHTDQPRWKKVVEELRHEADRLGSDIAWLDVDARRWSPSVSAATLEEAAEKVRSAQRAGRQYASTLATIAAGLRSRMVLDQLSALTESECAAPTPHPAEPRFRDALRRLRQMVDDEIRRLDLSPRDSALLTLLEQKARGAQSAMAAVASSVATRPRRGMGEPRSDHEDAARPLPPHDELPRNWSAPQALRDSVRAYFQALERSRAP